MGKYSDEGARYFNEKNNRHPSICIYCTAEADSREHIPSRIFLDKPYPDNLAIAPACSRCNSDFSMDELYVACFLDYFFYALAGKQTNLRLKTKEAFAHDENLSNKISSCFNMQGEKLAVTYDFERIKRIVLKLSVGHVANKLDCLVNLQDDVHHFAMRFKPDLLPEEMHLFEELPIINKLPEIGSDFVHHDLFIAERVDGSDVIGFLPWQIVQEGNYRFMAFHSGNDTTTVRIVIFELLFAEVIFTI
jgi:hypothetical protein